MPPLLFFPRGVIAFAIDDEMLLFIFRLEIILILMFDHGRDRVPRGRVANGTKRLASSDITPVGENSISLGSRQLPDELVTLVLFWVQRYRIAILRTLAAMVGFHLAEASSFISLKVDAQNTVGKCDEIVV